MYTVCSLLWVQVVREREGRMQIIPEESLQSSSVGGLSSDHDQSLRGSAAGVATCTTDSEEIYG